jgi:uncharacterized protein (TIGR03067 family)
MKRSFLLVLAASCACAAGAGKVTENEAELKRLQGVWRAVRLERAGEMVAEASLPGARFVIQGTAVRFRVGERTLLDVRFTVSPARRPAWIDLTSQAGPTKGKTVRAIYCLEGKRLTLCWPMGEDQRRPTRFDTKADQDWVLLTLERD